MVTNNYTMIVTGGDIMQQLVIQKKKIYARIGTVGMRKEGEHFSEGEFGPPRVTQTK